MYSDSHIAQLSQATVEELLEELACTIRVGRERVQAFTLVGLEGTRSRDKQAILDVCRHIEPCFERLSLVAGYLVVRRAHELAK